MGTDRRRKREPSPSAISTSEEGKALRAAKAPSGLARIARQQRMEAADVILAASGHVLGTLKLDKERLASLRLLGEYYGLWGAGRRPPGETPEKPEGFKVK